MSESDIIIIGGGLAGVLSAVALHKKMENCRILLLEAGPSIGRSHRWSYFSSDLDLNGHALLADLEKLHWPEYEVRFPRYSRRMQAAYYSFTDRELHKWARTILHDDAIYLNCNVSQCDAQSVTLENGCTLTAPIIIDSRGWDPEGISSSLALGYQKFVGILLNKPNHGQVNPVIMDATVEQIDGYRFIYTLPLDQNHLFVEDTYYSDNAELDVPAVIERLNAYLTLPSESPMIVPEETGILPIVISGDLSMLNTNSDAIPIGVRGGYFHHVTSYSLPHAVNIAIRLAELVEKDEPALNKQMGVLQEKSWRTQGFGRMLNKMLFRGSSPQQKLTIMQRFYSLPEGTIERFYGSKLSTWDKMRILAGRPPIPIIRAIKAILS